jgi:hypothetical protein
MQRKSHLCIPRKELCGFSPIFYILVAVSDSYIPRSGPHIFLQQNRQTAHRHINFEIGTEAVQFLLLEIFVSNFRYGAFAM